MLRLLKEMPRVEFSTIDPSASVVRAGISLWEAGTSYQDLPEPPPGCAVCGSDEFKAGERLPAWLVPRLERGESSVEYLMQVWVHPACFASCVETDEPDPIPW